MAIREEECVSCGSIFSVLSGGIEQYVDDTLLMCEADVLGCGGTCCYEASDEG